MSINKKYIKFGLRADKNLSDLSNSDLGISNILNDISSNLNKDGQKTGFGLEDIGPLRGLRNTGALARNVAFGSELESGTPDGQSNDLADLSGSEVQFIVSTLTELTTSPGQKLNIEPMLTMQDYIDNSKSILGDPPWLSGGNGPLCEFVPSDRINPAVITKDITGDSAAGAVGSLLNTQIFSTSTSESDDYGDIIKGEDFWDNGQFSFPGKLHPTFRNKFGLIQWTGYITETPAQSWESSGLFMIEEETSTADQYNKLKSVFASSSTIGNLIWPVAGEEEIITVSTATVGFNEISRYVCQRMKVSLPGSDTVIGKVLFVDNERGECDVLIETGESLDVSTTASGGSTIGVAGLVFSFDIGSVETISANSLISKGQRLGDRTKMRYTLWFPSLTGNEIYPNKMFREISGSTALNLPFSAFYSTSDIETSPPTYSHRYFQENKGGIINQRVESGKKLQVNNSVHITYTPQDRIAKVLATAVGAESLGTHLLDTKQILIQENGGRLYCKKEWDECSVGDWITFKINSSTTSALNYCVSYQIEEISGPYAFVDPSINDMPELKVVNTVKPAPILAIVFKNSGLVGNFCQTRTNTLTELVLPGTAMESGKRYRIKTVSTTSSGFTGAGASGNSQNIIFISNTSAYTGDGTVVLEADSVIKGNLHSVHSKADSLLSIAATEIVEGSRYKITDLSGTTQLQWHTAAGTTSGTDYVIGDTFTASGVGAGTGKVRLYTVLPPMERIIRGNIYFSAYLITVGLAIDDGSFVVGTDYKITTLGSTDWNTVAGTIGVAYAVGHKFKAESVGVASTGGQATAKATRGLARPEKLNSYLSIENNSINATIGQRYVISNLGVDDVDVQSDWNTVAGTSSATYAVGDIITVAANLAPAQNLFDTAHSTRKMVLHGLNANARQVSSQNYYENPTSFYDDAARTNITAVYSSTGLEDQSQSSKCGGVIGKIVKAFEIANVVPSATVSPNNDPIRTAVITLDSVEGIQVGDGIHHPNFTTPNTSAGKIDNVDMVAKKIRVVASSSTISGARITQPYAPTEEYNLPVNSTIAIIGASVSVANAATGKLDACVIPLDTAPPFAGTGDGLATPTGDDLEIYNSTLSFSELNLVVNDDKIDSENSDVVVDSHFKIKHGSDTYKMLIKT